MMLRRTAQVNLFVADTGNHTIREVVVSTRAVTTLAGYPGLPGSSDGTGSAARFNRPSSITADGAGNLFIADSGNRTIRKLVIETGAVTTVAGSAASAGSLGPADGVGAAARFDNPHAIAVDSIGDLFIADQTTIRKVVIDTGVVTTIVGSWPHAEVILGPLPAGLNSPSGLAVGPDGSLFITDANENSVLQVH